MALTTTAIAAIGLGVAAAGTATSAVGGIKQAQASAEAEKLRKRQMRLDAERQRREIARKALIARSTAVSNATVQGAEGGTGLQGGIAQVQGRALSDTAYTNQSERIGSQIFDANAAYAQAGGVEAFGNGLSSLGGAIMNNAGVIHRLGTYYTQRP